MVKNPVPVWDGYLYEFYRRDISAPDLPKRTLIYAIAKQLMTSPLYPDARLIDQGPEVLAKARSLGVANDAFGVFDGEDG